jgi:alginate O-acetyltransferase complex protein AlgI
MAIGSAKLFGISLTQNFNRPYLATSVMEFWRRWHISFSRWLLDYLFKPLQMQLRTWKSTGTAVAILITFLASGAWHGASWNFVVWGGIHGFLMACSAWTRPARTRVVQSLSLSGSRVLGVWRVVFTFGLLSVTWVFFRAESLDDAIYVLTRAWSTTGIGLASLTHTVFLDQPIAEAALAVVGLAVLGALGLAKGGTGILTPEQFLRDSSASVRYAAYLALGYALAVVPAPAARTFIYFQF